MDEFPFSALFLFAQSCLTDAVNVIFSDYCFTDTYLRRSGLYGHSYSRPWRGFLATITAASLTAATTSARDCIS